MLQKPNPLAEALRQRRDLEVSLRKLYCRQAATLIRNFDRWKGKPEYYFIELKLDMTYFCAGFAVRVADPPYHLGTIIRNSFKNPELFSCECPDGNRAFAYAYNGSPLSGRFELGMACPECGWNEWVTQSGWKARSEALKATQTEDARRLSWVKLFHPRFRPADLRDLLRQLGVPEEDLVLPPLEHKVVRTKMQDGTVILNDPDGGSVIISSNKSVSFHNWNGPEGMFRRGVGQLTATNLDGADGKD